MIAKEAKKLIGQKVAIQRRYSGIVDHGTILSVKGRNVQVDFMGMTDWLWLPDCIIRPTPRPPMTDLSPAAQAVLDAALEHSGPAFEPLARKMVADALRALAARINGADAIRQDVLDIAAELEASNDH